MLALYLLSSALAFCCAWSQVSRERSWWLVIAMILIAIAVVRAAQPGRWLDGDLQQWVRALGWYDYRRPVQVVGIGVAILLLLVGAKLMRTTEQDVTWPARFAAIALFLLLALAAVRGSSLHWTDAVLERDFAGLILSHALQATLLATICASAICRLIANRMSAAQPVSQGRS